MPIFKQTEDVKKTAPPTVTPTGPSGGSISAPPPTPTPDVDAIVDEFVGGGAPPPSGGGAPPSTPAAPDREVTPDLPPELLPPAPAAAPGSGFLPSGVMPGSMESLPYRSVQYGVNRFTGGTPESFGPGSPIISAGDLVDDPNKRSLEDAISRLLAKQRG